MKAIALSQLSLWLELKPHALFCPEGILLLQTCHIHPIETPHKDPGSEVLLNRPQLWVLSTAYYWSEEAIMHMVWQACAQGPHHATTAASGLSHQWPWSLTSSQKLIHFNWMHKWLYSFTHNSASCPPSQGPSAGSQRAEGCAKTNLR